MSAWIKTFDIALKDLKSAFRSASAWVFMFGLPLMIAGLFYLMLGSNARSGGFSLPVTKLAVANLDRAAPRLRASARAVPGGVRADTLSDLVVAILESDDLRELVRVVRVDDADAARQAVDDEQAAAALIIPPGFSRRFAEPYEQSELELYQDPTLSIGPAVVESILNQFMDGLGGIKIAIRLTLDHASQLDPRRIDRLIAEFMEGSPANEKDLSGALLDVRRPRASSAPLEQASPLLTVVSSIMGGMMIFYAFYTGAAGGESILQEEEKQTLKRLFTTPTPQAVILTGKFLAVFLTVLIQVCVLLTASWLVFGIRWGDLQAVALAAFGMVCAAASFGVFINSIRRSTRQGGVIFGGVLTITGLLGVIRIFAIGSPHAVGLGESVSLLVPQGWAVRGLLEAMEHAPLEQTALTTLGLLGWSAVFLAVGIWRFRRRYA
ncbi:MAG: ABC transporter permease [Anaerolineales bacterium]|nr:ABC transporter permease [Anaerolineales bacterium]